MYDNYCRDNTPAYTPLKRVFYVWNCTFCKQTHKTLEPYSFKEDENGKSYIPCIYNHENAAGQK